MIFSICTHVFLRYEYPMVKLIDVGPSSSVHFALCPFYVSRFIGKSSSSFLACTTGVHSTLRRHQPPQRAVLGQVDCFVQCEVVGSQVSLDGVQPRDTRTPWWSVPLFIMAVFRPVWISWYWLWRAGVKRAVSHPSVVICWIKK